MHADAISAEYVPASHPTHAAAPVVLMFSPAGQLAQLYWLGEPVVPTYLPEPHLVHAESAVMPGVSEYLRGGGGERE